MQNPLEIYLEQDWRSICVNFSDANKVLADSACRQMGYTSAESYSPDVPKYIVYFAKSFYYKCHCFF